MSKRLTNEDSVVFVCENTDSSLVGLQLYPVFSSTRMSLLWVLNDLFVEETFRRKSIGRQLVNRCQQHCKETGARIDTRNRSDKLYCNLLYTDMGFAPISGGIFMNGQYN